MTCKGVYASLGFNVYITKDDLYDLFLYREITGNVYIGKQKVGGGWVDIRLNNKASDLLLQAYNQDKEAIQQAKSSMVSGYIGRKRTKY